MKLLHFVGLLTMFIVMFALGTVNGLRHAGCPVVSVRASVSSLDH